MTKMAAGSKRRSPAQDKRAVEPPAPASKPFLRFYHSAELRNKTLLVLDKIEQAKDPALHREDLADVALELMNSGFDYFFMKPLKLAKAGFIVQQSANLGLAGAQQVMGSVIRNIIERMDGPQLRSVCASIREFMR